MGDLFSLKSSGIITRIDYDGGTNAIYIGEATPGALTSQALWRIKKITYDGNNNVTSILWANKESVNFTQIYDNRATLSYA